MHTQKSTRLTRLVVIITAIMLLLWSGSAPGRAQPPRPPERVYLPVIHTGQPVNENQNLNLTLSGPATATVGSFVEYTLRIENVGDHTYQNLLVQFPLDDLLRFNWASQQGAVGTMDNNQATVVWTLPSLPAGAVLELNFRLQAWGPGAAGLLPQALPPGEPPATGNYLSLSITDTLPAAGSGMLTLAVVPTNTVRVGQVLIYTVALTNSGSADLVGGVISQSLPANLMPLDLSHGGQPQQGYAVWPLADLPVGQGVTRTLLLQAISPGQVRSRAALAATNATLTGTAILTHSNEVVSVVEVIATDDGAIDGRLNRDRLGLEPYWPAQAVPLASPLQMTVNLSNGNLVVQSPGVQAAGRGVPFNLTHTYNSRAAGANTGFGNGWTLSLAAHLELTDDGRTAVWVDPDGTRHTYTRQLRPNVDGNFEYISPPGEHSLLTQSGSGYTLAIFNGPAYYFDPQGRLTMLGDSHHNRLHFTYHSGGLLAAVADDAGREVSLTYRGGLLDTVTDWTGRVWRYRYREQQLTEIEDPLGGQTRFTYNLDGYLAVVLDPDQNTTRISYAPPTHGPGSAGAVVGVSLPTGNRLGFDYTSSGIDSAYRLETRYRDGLANTWLFVTDSYGRLTESRNPLNELTRQGYDNDHNLTELFDPNGNHWVWTYDEHGNMLSRRTPLGHITRFTYGRYGFDGTIAYRLEEQIDALGHTTRFRYNGPGDLLAAEDALGWKTAFTYNHLGDLLTTTTANGDTTTYEYDEYGYLRRAVDPLGFTLDTWFDSLGRVTATHSRNGWRTAMRYDALGRLLEQTDPNGAGHTYTYSANGLLLAEVHPGYGPGQVTRYEYNGLGQPTTLTNPLGGQTRIIYNAAGQPAQQIDANGHAAAFSYDAAGRLTAQRDPLLQTTRYRYAAGGQQVTVVDPRGAEIRYLLNEEYRPEAVIDALGGRTLLAYDAAGRLVSRTNANGHATRFEYDGRNNLIREIDPLGHATAYQYDPAGNRIGLTNRRGHTTRYEYDALNRLVKTISPPVNGQSYETVFEYDPDGNLHKMINPAGYAYKYEYNPLGQVERAVDPLGYESITEYDAAGRPMVQRNALGFETHLYYDALGRLTQTVDALGQSGYFEYDAVGNLARITDSKLQITSYEYDPLNRRVAQIDALGQRSTYAYDAAGNLTGRTNPAGATWRTEYDLLNRPVRAIDPLGHSRAAGYDALGQPVWQRDARGNETRTAYDALGRPARLTDALGYETTFEYDEEGNLTTATNPRGYATRYSYDALDRRIETRNALNYAATFAYDPRGLLTAQTDPAGYATRFEYDALGRQIRTINAQGHAAETEYDALGRPTLRRDALGRETRLSYDALGRLTQTLNALGQATTFTYDAAGNLLTQANALGHTWQYEYDALNRKVGQTDPINRQWAYEYDTAGNLAAVVEPGNHRLTHSYDAAGRLIRREAPDGVFAAFEYDPVGNMTRLFDRDQAGREHQTLFEYDARNQLARYTDPFGFETTYQYGPAGNRSQLSSSLGTVAYEYDELNRLSLVRDVRDENSQTLAYTYNERNLLTHFYPPDLATPMTYEYDELGRAVTVAGPESQYHYSYDAAGNLLTAEQSLTPNTNNGLTTYTYDALNRLVGWDGPSGNDTIIYDAAGRKISDDAHTYTYNAAGQLLNDGAQDYTYDERGNQLTAGPETYTYDGLNRLVQVTPDLYGIAMSVSFEIDGMGRKLKRTSGPAQGPGVTQGLTFHYPDGGLNVLWKESDRGLERFRYLTDAYRVTVRETESQIGLPTVDTWLGYNGRGDVGYLVNAADQAIGNFSYAPQDFNNIWQVSASAGVTNRGTGFRGQVLPWRGPGLSRPLLACPPDTSGPIGYTAAVYTGDITGWTSVVGETQATYDHYQTLSEHEITTHTCRTQTGTEDVVDPVTGQVTGTRPVYSYQDYTNTGCNNGPPADQCTASNQSWVSHDYGNCGTYKSEMNARTWSLTANAYTVPSGTVDWPSGSLTPTCEPQLDKLTFDEWWDTYTIVDQQMQALYGPEWANAAILTYQVNRLMLLEGTDQNFCERNPGACDALMWLADELQHIRPGTPNYCDYHPADCAAWEWAKGLPSAPVRLWDYFTTAIPRIGSQEYGVPSATFPLMIELMLFDAGPNGRTFDETAYVQSRINQAQLYQMQRGFGNTAQLTLEGTSAAFDTYFLAGAAYQGGRFAYNAFGRTGWNTVRSGVAAEGATSGTGVRPNFYIKPDGTVVPATGYRYMDSEASYINDVLNTQTIANPSGRSFYITPARFNNATQARNGLQISTEWSDAAVRAEFDTLQVIDDVQVPTGTRPGTLPHLEPLTADWPEYGIGGTPQYITTNPILVSEIEVLPDPTTAIVPYTEPYLPVLSK